MAKKDERPPMTEEAAEDEAMQILAADDPDLGRLETVSAIARLRSPAQLLDFAAVAKETRARLQADLARGEPVARVEKLTRQIQAVAMFQPATVEAAIEKGETLDRLQRELRQAETDVSGNQNARAWLVSVEGFAPQLFGLAKGQTTYSPRVAVFPAEITNWLNEHNVTSREENAWAKLPETPAAAPKKQPVKLRTVR